MKSIVLPCFIVLLLSLQQDGSVTKPSQAGEALEVKGHVVLFDWSLHGLGSRSAEDLVVRLSEPRRTLPRYVRVVYPGVAELAPDEIKAKYGLSNQLFVGRGAVWTFQLLSPKGLGEESLCDRNYLPVKVTDELGSIEIPQFFPTPGTPGEKVPTLSSLPCFMMIEHPRAVGPTAPQRPRSLPDR